LIFSVFLPPLVFEAAIFINWREFKNELPVVTLLATVGVVLAATVTAVGMQHALSWDWGSAVVFGTLIAATDPVSVIATFKESKVQGRLRMLIGGTIAYLLMLLAGGTPDYLVEITFTTLAAYGSLFVAEHYRCSGVLAVSGNYRASLPILF
jgi:CPA1 family monovalent cation:H+ antiporter